MGKKNSKNHSKSASHKQKYSDVIDKALVNHVSNKYRKKYFLNYEFNMFAKKMSDIVGNAGTFIVALAIVIIWGFCGRYFKYSDTWQLVINTSTTIITFLVVFLIQNTQNRDTEILNLKIDELIRSKKGARNHVINLDALSDIELKNLEKEYIKLCNARTGQ